MKAKTSSTEKNLALYFYRVAECFENNTALKYIGGVYLSYGELNRRSNQIARFMLNKGISMGDRVVIFNDKSINSFCLIFACIKIGVVYCNLDRNNPVSRLNKMLAAYQPACIFDFIADKNNLLIDLQKNVVWTYLDCKSGFHKLFERQENCNLKESYQITSDSALYVVFTSGSTGTPKGALISHNNIQHFIGWAQSRLGIVESDHLTNINPIHFDNSVFDIYAALFSGACLSPIEARYLSTPHLLVESIEKLACNTWFSVPSLIIYLLTTKSWLKGRLPDLKKIIFGGEGFPKRHLKKLYQLANDECQLINVYGPTECSCICSAHTVQERDFDNMLELAPLGKIAEHFKFKVLDEDGLPADNGELILSGKSIGLGYINDPQQTSEHFYQIIDNCGVEQYYYKTGDIVRLKNQQLYFLGRKDNQIKHMGHRIELEEIENQVNTFKEVVESCAGYVKSDIYAGTIVLVVSLQKSASVEQLKRSVNQNIAEYMRPKKIIKLAQLPKNNNGKIDRKLIQLEYLSR